MTKEIRITLHVCLALALITLGEAFFLRWGSEPTQSVATKAWVTSPQMSPLGQLAAMNMGQLGQMQQMQQLQQMQQVPQSYRGYGYSASPYEARRGAYQAENLLGALPISVPMQASLTPVALQHVQLVPCMCPVAAEEADKLHEAGPGPYLAQAQPDPASKQ